ncbi:MAG: Preprotein translocase subunit SecD [Parcubacteria group bacterium GW2011_GWC1_38_6]|nr:MAG: Preprotein translocase subunit SecD [Parcubacteria group bacterium GW2011_GWC1_38_6]
MQKQRVYTIVFFILVLAFFVGNFSYPNYFNKSVDFLNAKFNWQVPHFWNVPFKLGLDLQGGSHLLYEADLSQIAEKERGQAMEGLRDIIERRVNFFGVAEPLVQVQNAGDKYRLIVELAGVIDPAEAVKQIGQTPFLEFKEQKSQEESQKILDKAKELEGKTPEEAQKIENWESALEDPYFKSTSLTGRYLKKAEIGFEQNAPKPLISIEFNDEGSKLFEELTQNNIGKPIAIYIDGVLISAPVVQSKIVGGKAQITGNFDIKSAQELARNLNAGALPLPITLISQESVGPVLGKISLEKSLKSGFIGFLAVIMFMVIFYRLPGILASLALIIYIAIILALFKLIPVTLTLAGIAGFVLSIGMAVDANILIFARMKEEFAEGKNFTISLAEGFSRAWPSIRDSNITTIITSLILFGFGTGFVKGFAFTLIIGVLISMFSAVFITRYFLKLFDGSKIEKSKWLWQ